MTCECGGDHEANASRGACDEDVFVGHVEEGRHGSIACVGLTSTFPYFLRTDVLDQKKWRE